MPETFIENTVTSDFKNTQTDFSVSSKETLGVADQKETRHQNFKWSQYHGYYRAIPELRSAIDAKATWTVGKGFKADPSIKVFIDRIDGYGKDTFNTILESMIRTTLIGGDAYAEVIRNDDDELINIKPLDPGSIVIITNQKGIIIRYEQVSKTKFPDRKLKPEKIFHLSRNRVADEILGVSVIEALEQDILARNEAKADYKIVMHRNVVPLRIWHMDTDDEPTIAKFKAKVQGAKENFEDIFVPKGAVVPELASVAPNATMNPLAWIESLNDDFYATVGVPKIIVGNSKNFTEASAKIVYLAFQQNIEEDQLYIEEQVGMQLGIGIELEFPASLEADLLSDKAKDVTATGAAQPNDTTETLPGAT